MSIRWSSVLLGVVLLIALQYFTGMFVFTRAGRTKKSASAGVGY